MSDKKLTIKQKLFVDNYLSNNFNGTKAAITAGFKEKTAYSTAYELLKKPHIKDYIDGKLKVMSHKSEVTYEWKIEMLRKAAEASMTGQTTKDALIDAKSLVSCLSELNKMQGHHAAEKRHVESNTTLSVDTVLVEALEADFKKNLKDY